MTTLELLQLQNEHKDNFFVKGEDVTEEQEGEYVMFEDCSRLTKKQKILLNAIVTLGLLINWIDYNDDGSITFQLENAYYDMPGLYFCMPANYTMTKKGEIKKL